MTVGRHGVLNADEARQRAALIVTRIKAGEDPVPLPLAARARANGSPTVADLAARYLKDHVEVRLKPGTQAKTRGVLRRHILPAARQAAGRGGGAPARGRSAPRAERPPGDGEPGGQDAFAHVPPRRGLGSGAGGLQPVPVDRGNTPSAAASAS